VPPGLTVAEESVKLVWACTTLLNGKQRTARSVQLLKNMIIFIELRGTP
jgi:hypothetical protein